MLREAIRVCPRCSRPYSYIKEKKINGRIYLYAVHYIKDGPGKRRVVECYLGPKDHYEYVTRMHEKEGLILRGLMEQERAVEYLSSIVNYVTNIDLDRDQAKYLTEILKEAVNKLEEKY